ncbi:MAG: hypothetical protein AAF564_20180 [Bacteroidota bacterium]
MQPTKELERELKSAKLKPLDVSLQTHAFTVQDEHKVTKSFDIYVWIWDPSSHEWVQQNIDILNTNSFSSEAEQSINAVFNISADLKAVNHSGSSTIKGQPGNLAFAIFDHSNHDISGSVFFTPHGNRWQWAGANEEQIDIDWKWDDGSPKIELREKK